MHLILTQGANSTYTLTPKTRVSNFPGYCVARSTKKLRYFWENVFLYFYIFIFLYFFKKIFCIIFVRRVFILRSFVAASSELGHVWVTNFRLFLCLLVCRIGGVARIFVEGVHNREGLWTCMRDKYIQVSLRKAWDPLALPSKKRNLDPFPYPDAFTQICKFVCIEWRAV